MAYRERLISACDYLEMLPGYLATRNVILAAR